MNANVLEVEELAGGYTEVTVIRSFSGRACAGEVSFVTGRNGVGKSTLMKLIMGHLSPASGRVMFRGENLTALAGYGRRHLGLGYAPQEEIVFSELTVAENLTLQYDNRSLDRYAHLFAQFPFLGERLGQKAGTLSGGEKKILSFCRALAEDTQVVIMDEPTEGVQPENIARMSAVIKEQIGEGRGFLIVEQNLNVIEEVGDRVYLVDRGECVFSARNEPGLRDELVSRLRI